MSMSIYLLQYIVNIIMGNSEDCITVDSLFHNKPDLLDNLILIEESHCHNQILAIGQFEILRSRYQPYELIMKHNRAFPLDHPKCQEYSAMARLVASRASHKNIAKIHTINLCSKSNICDSKMVIETYTNYYAINIQQVIDQRKAKDDRFTTGEIWYLLNALTDLSHYLKQKQLYFGIYLPKNIHLSIEGYLKVYLFHLTPNNEHLLYRHMANSSPKEMHKCLPLPPECLPLIQLEIQELRHVSIQKIDVFGIAMIALEAMLFGSTRKYYANHQSYYTFDHKQLEFDLHELEEAYPPQLIQVIQKMVKIDPKERMGIQQAREYINIRKGTQIHGSIRLLEDEDCEQSARLSYRNINKQKENERILKSITSDKANGESKLQFMPLRRTAKERKENILQLSVDQQPQHFTGIKKKKKISLSKEKQLKRYTEEKNQLNSKIIQSLR